MLQEIHSLDSVHIQRGSEAVIMGKPLLPPSESYLKNLRSAASTLMEKEAIAKLEALLLRPPLSSAQLRDQIERAELERGRGLKNRLEDCSQNLKSQSRIISRSVA